MGNLTQLEMKSLAKFLYLLLTEYRDTDISETWVLWILTRGLTPAYHNLTNQSAVYQAGGDTNH